MDRDELVERYFAAWKQRNTADLLRLMHPQASYYDAFWGETCSGKDLSTYFAENFALDSLWYKPVDDPVITQNGMVIRYLAFEGDDTEGLRPIFNGAEIITLSDGLIMTISDHYCDPSATELIELASYAEGQHGRANVVQRGLSTRAAGNIKRQLASLAKDMTVLRDSSLTVTKLAKHMGCSVMHLFHVLEDQQDTTFLQYVNESRARYASTLLTESASGECRFDQIAEQCGFESIEEFRKTFQNTFGMSADEYVERFTE